MAKPDELLWPSQPRTLIKHQIYRKYVYCWMGKICGSFPESAIVDAFAGPGAYKDGPDGSPVVITKAFLEHSQQARFKTLKLIFMEKRKDRRDHLDQLVGAIPHPAKLKPIVLPEGEAIGLFELANQAAHGGDPRRPTLWILDPFDISSVPFDLVAKCLAQPRDEVLVTWFADEIYRFCEDPTKEIALTRHFGSDSWKQAGHVTGEAARKESLLSAYRDHLQTKLGVHTESFSISSKNESARYSLVYATHSDSGMECFNAARWSIDKYRGKSVSEKRGTDQLELFAERPELSGLETWLRGLAGTAVPFEELERQTWRLGYQTTHLRRTLDELAVEGVAEREHPLAPRSAWPDDCRVRFYDPARE